MVEAGTKTRFGRVSYVTSLRTDMESLLACKKGKELAEVEGFGPQPSVLHEAEATHVSRLLHHSSMHYSAKRVLPIIWNNQLSAIIGGVSQNNRHHR